MNLLCRRMADNLMLDGIFISILGALMILLPQLTTYMLSLVLSLILLFFGCYRSVIAIIKRHSFDNWFLSLVIGLLTIFAGAYLVLNPIFSEILLTVLIGIYFILECINTTMLAVQTKDILKYWWISLLTAAIQFLLAMIILVGLPFTSAWTVGLLFGINLFFSGIMMLVLSISTKKAICSI